MFCDPDEIVEVSVDHATTTGQISISSRNTRDQKTQKHLTSWVTPEPSAQIANTEAPSDSPETTLNGSSLHGSNRALAVGEYFHSLQTIQIWPGRIIAQLSLSKPARADRVRFALHPGLLDGFFGLAHTLAMHTGADQAAAYIPFCIEDVYVFAPLRDTEYRADLRAVKTAEEFLRFDGELIDAAGKVVIAIRGLDHRRVASDSPTNVRPGNTTMTKLKLRSTSVKSREIKEPADSTLVVKQQTFTSSPAVTLSRLRTLLAEVLLCQASSIDVNGSLVEQGVDSILALEFVQRINRDFGLRRQGTILFEFPTLAQLAQELETRPDTPPSRQTIPEPNAVLKPPAPELVHQLTNLIAQTLLRDPASINTRQSLIEQGVDSILGLEFVQAINRTFSLRLPGTVLFEYPTIENLTSWHCPVRTGNRDCSPEKRSSRHHTSRSCRQHNG